MRIAINSVEKIRTITSNAIDQTKLLALNLSSESILVLRFKIAEM